MKKLTILGVLLLSVTILISCGEDKKKSRKKKKDTPETHAKAYQDCLCAYQKLLSDGKTEESTKKIKECLKITNTHIDKYKDDEDGAKEYAAEILKVMKEDCPE